MARKMRDKTRKSKYLTDPSRCPHCGCDLDAGDADGVPVHFFGELELHEDGEVTQEIECGSCGNRWADVYTMTDVRFLAPRRGG